MPTLKEQIQSVKNELEWCKKADQAKHIIEECGLIYDRLVKPHEKLRRLILEFNILHRLPDEYIEGLKSSEDIANQGAKCMHSLQRFKALWEAKQHQARSHDELANAETSLEMLVDAFGKAIRESWDLWVEQITSRVAVEDIKLESQRSLPGLERVYSDYVVSQNQLKGILKRIPSEAAAIDTIKSLCEQMVALKSKMQWDVDPEIADFFDRLDRAPLGKIPLSLLSRKVIAWLEEQGYLDQFVIQRRGSRH